VSRIIVKAPASDGHILTADDLEGVSLGDLVANGVVVGRILVARIIDGGHAIEYEAEVTDPEALADVIVGPRTLPAGHAKGCTNGNHDPNVSLCTAPAVIFGVDLDG
jgi:hypothetical protein